MATIAHKNIPSAQAHEPKGVESAVNKSLYVANGSGSGTWSKIGPQSLSNISTNGVAGQFVAVDGAGNFVLASAPSGSIYFYNVSTPYTLTYPSVFTKAAPTTIASGSPTLITEGTNARLTYTGASTTSLDVAYIISFDQASGADRDVQAAIYKNGTVVPGSQAIVTSSSGQKHQLICHADVSVSLNDYIEIYMKNDGASGDVRIYAFTMQVTTAGA
jgi:hypothetical protein